MKNLITNKKIVWMIVIIMLLQIILPVASILEFNLFTIEVEATGSRNTNRAMVNRFRK